VYNLLPSHILKSIEELYELPDPDERPTHGGGRPFLCVVKCRRCPLRAATSAVAPEGQGTPSRLLSGVGVWEVGVTWLETWDVSTPW
jgi:hypothetical protein